MPNIGSTAEVVKCLIVTRPFGSPVARHVRVDQLHSVRLRRHVGIVQSIHCHALVAYCPRITRIESRRVVEVKWPSLQLVGTQIRSLVRQRIR